MDVYIHISTYIYTYIHTYKTFEYEHIFKCFLWTLKNKNKKCNILYIYTELIPMNLIRRLGWGSWNNREIQNVDYTECTSWINSQKPKKSHLSPIEACLLFLQTAVSGVLGKVCLAWPLETTLKLFGDVELCLSPGLLVLLKTCCIQRISRMVEAHWAPMLRLKLPSSVHWKRTAQGTHCCSPTVVPTLV